jgi:hypothetical protein
MDGETRIDSVLFSTWKSNLETVSNVNHRATVMKPIRKRIRQRPLSSTAVSHGRRYVNDATRCQTNCCQKPRRVAAAFGHGTFLETESFFDHHSTEANLDEERRSHANRQCDSRQSMESGAIERRHCDRRAASRETRDARRETRECRMIDIIAWRKMCPPGHADRVVSQRFSTSLTRHYSLLGIGQQRLTAHQAQHLSRRDRC